MKYRAAYDLAARETPALERKLRQILKFAEVKDEREDRKKIYGSWRNLNFQSEEIP